VEEAKDRQRRRFRPINITTSRPPNIIANMPFNIVDVARKQIEAKKAASAHAMIAIPRLPMKVISAAVTPFYLLARRASPSLLQFERIETGTAKGSQGDAAAREGARPFWGVCLLARSMDADIP
jgi:hypothetical protein